MIGNNVLEMNEATMIAAVQMYLDSLMVIKGTVVVTQVSGTNGITPMFKVQLSDSKQSTGNGCTLVPRRRERYIRGGEIATNSSPAHPIGE